MASTDQRTVDAQRMGAEPRPGGSFPERVYEHLGGRPLPVLAKLFLLALVNALYLYGLPAMLEQRAWTMLTAATLATVAINYVYLQRRHVHLKYLLPGTIFLFAFQIVPVVWTGYLAFTNFGAGHILNKQQAIDGIESANLFTPEDAVQYRMVPFAGPGDEIALLLTDPDGQQVLGTEDGLQPVEEVGEVAVEGEQIQSVGDYTRMSLAEAQDRAGELQQLRVPVEQGEIQPVTLTTAARREQLIVYDPDEDVMVHQEEGTVYRPQEGTFVSDDGQALTPGWRVPIGFDNFSRIFTSPQIRGPFTRVFIWTFAFAVLSVLTTFVFGLLLAMALNKPGMRGLRTYRSLLIFPYALPSYLTALIWAGMLNQSFGPVNEILNASIPWLNDPMWARASILLVNLWLGFPYMFLVSLGALQSIPGDVLEAARTDGATGMQAFRNVTFPLLLVSLAPLLIASFAFNFNNFNIVFLLTGGGPPIAGAQTPAGHTDILISYTYRLSFEGGRGPEYAFAAAIAVVIFLIVATLSAISFKYTKALEDVN